MNYVVTICNIFSIEDQQALEDEGIIFPIKQNAPTSSQMPSIYNRNQNTQPLQISSSNLPLYTASTMNYINPHLGAFVRTQYNPQNIVEDYRASRIESQSSILYNSIPVEIVSLYRIIQYLV